MNRSEVYKRIDGERDYQEWKWTNHSHEVAAYLTLLDSHLREAQDAWSGKPGDFGALEGIRKIAAIAVACMEEHGVPPREETWKLIPKR